MTRNRPTRAARRKGCKHPQPGSFLAVDTETTGHDIHHGCRPFIVSACDDEGEIFLWEWPVDPEKRKPIPPKREVKEVQACLDGAQSLVMHNAKFDIRALQSIGIKWTQNHWGKLEDTLVASHVLDSAESHGLKDLALRYLDIVDDDQQHLRDLVNEARRYARSYCPDWRIAETGDPHFPAVTRAPRDGWWVMDMWLPRALWLAGEDVPDDYQTVALTYASKDAERTAGMWLIQRDALEEMEGEDHYATRLKLLRITYAMEQRGISFSPDKLMKVSYEFSHEAEMSEAVAMTLADGQVDNLRSSKQLQGLLYGTFNFKPIKQTKTGWAVDAETLDALVTQQSKRSKGVRFVENLKATRSYRKAVDYLSAYRASGVKTREGMFLRPSFNVTGTATTRLSGQDPNPQNISKKERINLRQIFGPVEGREWWAMDYSNIELRIFAYASGDKRLIQAFEEGQSVHMVIAEELHPEQVRKLGPEAFQKTDAYRWTKNGNFSLIYGASKRKADATYKVDGAYERIRSRFPSIDKFMAAKYRDARKRGYITTLGGYPLIVPRDGPHKAVNYFIQGSAGWAMVLAMVRVAEYLDTLQDHHLIMTIHDELDMDFPKGTPRKIPKQVKRLMEQSGEDLGIPTPVDADLITTNWAEGKGVKL